MKTLLTVSAALAGVGLMTPALQAQDQTTDEGETELLRPPPAKQVAPPSSLARGATTRDEREWARLIQENYPLDALRLDWQGTVGVRVVINDRSLL